jgi:hypothetical protein
MREKKGKNAFGARNQQLALTLPYLVNLAVSKA